MLPYINSEHMPLLYYKAHSILHPVKVYQNQEIKKRPGFRLQSSILVISLGDQHAYQEIYSHLSLCYHVAKTWSCHDPDQESVSHFTSLDG